MEIIKKENGNIEFRNGGVLVFSMPQLPTEIRPIDKDERDHVKLFQSDGRVEYIYVDDVTETQIEPAAPVPFAGTVFDLADLLSSSFFFEVVGGIYDSYRNISQRMYIPESFSNTSILANNLYSFKIKNEQNTTIDEFIINVNTPAVSGNAVVGLYSIGSIGVPDELIVQTAIEFDLTLSGQQIINIPPTKLSAGFYCLSYLADTAATLKAFNPEYPNFGGGFGGFMYGRLLTSLPYSSTLPTTHPIGGVFADANVPEILITTV